MESGLKRNLGLWPATFLLFGMVVGTSIFLVPGTQASQMGPSVWFIYVVGGILTIPVCLNSAQIGSVLPVHGASYQIIKFTTNTYISFLFGWIYIIALCLIIPYSSFAIATYATMIIPGISASTVAIATIIIITVLNCAGISFASKVQTVMVISLIGIMVLFSIGSLANMKIEYMTPMFPLGIDPVLANLIPAYFGFTGFFAITELSGEIKNPKKNIPLVIFVSFTLVIVLYAAMTAGLTGLIPYTELNIDNPIVVASQLIFPKWLSYVVLASAFFATTTTVLACAMIVSREVYSLAVDGIFPKVLTKTSQNGTPYYSCIAVGVVGIIITFISSSIMQYLGIITLFILFIVSLSAFASMKIKKAMPENYEKAEFKLKGITYYLSPIIVILSSLFMFIYSIVNDINAVIAIAVVVGSGTLIYVLRKGSIAKAKEESIALLDKELAELNRN